MPRTLKVAECGDHWKKKTYPQIRLQGKWLREMGIDSNTRVEIIPAKGGRVIVKPVKKE